MGRWRGRIIGACGLAALAFATAGCGAQEHENDPRPQPPTRVSVSVTENGITVIPARIAFGPEPTQQIPQNAHAGQPPVQSKAPLDVVFVVANLTDRPSRLEVRGPETDVPSERLIANGAVTLQTALPAGLYRISAAGIPRAKPASLGVGSYRSSSENDLLLP
jgi:hypothetical protein